MSRIEINVTELHESTYIMVTGINQYFREGPVPCTVIKSRIRVSSCFPRKNLKQLRNEGEN